MPTLAGFLAGEAIANDRPPFQRDARAPFALLGIDEFDAGRFERPPDRLNGRDFTATIGPSSRSSLFTVSTETRAWAATVDCSQRPRR
jgi:hypothetical protein